MSDSSTIRIHRTHVPKRDRLRQYKVIIDGQRSGTVADDQSEDFVVAPGEHSVQLKIDWTGSPVLPIKVGAGQTLLLTAAAHDSGRSPVRDMLHAVKHHEDWIDLAEG